MCKSRKGSPEPPPEQAAEGAAGGQWRRDPMSTSARLDVPSQAGTWCLPSSLQHWPRSLCARHLQSTRRGQRWAASCRQGTWSLPKCL